jgi:hypothetical protein
MRAWYDAEPHTSSRLTPAMWVAGTVCLLDTRCLRDVHCHTLWVRRA